MGWFIFLKLPDHPKSEVGNLVAIQVGKQIQKVLENKRNLSLAQLAKLARIDQSRLVKVVHQEVRPSMVELQRIAYVLGVKVSFLVGEADEPSSVKTPMDPELVQLLNNPNLVVNFRLLGQLSVEDQRTLAKVIEGVMKRQSS
jgi:transcriptional regulator with XRE-family HTH domain